MENIYRHAQQGEPLQQAIVIGTDELALPVISATMTTVAAFLPMLIMTGSTGDFFAEIPKAVSFAIIASLIECLLILPIHYLEFGPRTRIANTGDTIEKDNLMLQMLRRFTERVLAFTMRFRMLSVVIVLAVFIVALAILGVSISGKIPLVRIQFVPDDYSVYYVKIEGPANIPIEEIDQHVREISEFIMQDHGKMAASAAGLYP